MVRHLIRSFFVTAAVIGSASAQVGDSKTVGEPLAALIVDGQNNHGWQQTTPLLRAILLNSGRFTVDVVTSPKRGEDIGAFAPKFGSYDVVVSNYNGQLWPKKTREAFPGYIRGGGGFVSVHAADNAFPNWADYNRMIGVGGWGRRDEKSGPYVRWRDGAVVRDTHAGRGGSHGRRHEFVLEARTPQHPILRGLPTRWKHTADELYDRLRGPAENLTVLATAYSDPKTGGSGEHEPLLMAISFGKGRVFHTALGHDTTAMKCIGFQSTLLRGSEWAATGRVTIPAADGFPSADAVSSRDPLKDVWTHIFDGKTLSGWTQKNGTATYRVEDGVIVGTTADGSPNSFLCSDRNYADFELEFEVMVDNRLNSGMQIRSASNPEFKNGRVHGPQVEIEASPGEAGHIYSEGTGRGWISPAKHRNDPARRKAFQNGKWNRYRVLADGARIQTWINDVAVGDVTDPKSKRVGFLGLQVHGIGRGAGPWQVRWRRIRIRELTR